MLHVYIVRWCETEIFVIGAIPSHECWNHMNLQRRCPKYLAASLFRPSRVLVWSMPWVHEWGVIASQRQSPFAFRIIRSEIERFLVAFHALLLIIDAVYKVVASIQNSPASASNNPFCFWGLPPKPAWAARAWSFHRLYSVCQWARPISFHLNTSSTTPCGPRV